MTKTSSVLSRLMPTTQQEATGQQAPAKFPDLIAEERHEAGQPMLRVADSYEATVEQVADIMASPPDAISPEHQGNTQPALVQKREWGINRASGSALGKLSEAFAVENELKAVKERMESGQTIIE